jgi:mono/diheme cytochrome c family protein
MGSRRIVVMLTIGGGVWAAALGPAGPASGQPRHPEMGRTLFVEKQCARCHLPRGERGMGPALEELQRPQGEMELAGRLWNHAPGMAAALTEKAFEWPQIRPEEMADLMTYLQADAARDPQPQLDKGQLTLLRKGCLKCHSLRREGGRIEPDLAERRDDYESAAAWAATMWTHTPRMAAMASRRGLPYPRFSGEEMGNLVGFLRSAAR